MNSNGRYFIVPPQPSYKAHYLKVDAYKKWCKNTRAIMQGSEYCAMGPGNSQTKNVKRKRNKKKRQT